MSEKEIRQILVNDIKGSSLTSTSYLTLPKLRLTSSDTASDNFRVKSFNA